MPKNEGAFAIYVWLDSEAEGEPNGIEYFDSEEAARKRAEMMINAGRFKYIWLGKYDPGIDDYDPLDEYPHE